MNEQSILPKEVKNKLDQGLELNIIDVREHEEVAQGMISGAKHIPLGELPVRHHEIEQTDNIILVCRSGNRSGKALEYLQMLGLKNLKNMEGGMLEWDKL
ncbi:rhodanese-like domain-containing protein [Chengkuizengella sp. SCS-71B]|uniref:rhodanese-like domain-containing protein n=1 Tax=Chengkuizengella sp. SCS-71B TaxID=3115290 RepID=UPI0032C23981